MTDDAASAARMLWSLAGPRGPMRSDAEDAQERRVLLRGDPVVAARALLDALRSPAPPPDVSLEDAQIEAADLLSQLLTSPGSGVLDVLMDSLGDPRTRAAALDAIALSAEQRASPSLAELVRRQQYKGWSDREMIKLASALGSIGDDESREAIAILNARGGWPRAVQDEIDLAAEWAG